MKLPLITLVALAVCSFARGANQPNHFVCTNKALHADKTIEFTYTPRNIAGKPSLSNVTVGGDHLQLPNQEPGIEKTKLWGTLISVLTKPVELSGINEYFGFTLPEILLPNLNTKAFFKSVVKITKAFSGPPANAESVKQQAEYYPVDCTGEIVETLN